MEDLRRVGEDRAQGVVRQLWIVRAEFFPRPPFGQEAQDEVHGEAGSLDNGLPRKDLGISVNVFVPSHRSQH